MLHRLEFCQYGVDSTLIYGTVNATLCQLKQGVPEQLDLFGSETELHNISPSVVRIPATIFVLGALVSIEAEGGWLRH